MSRPSSPTPSGSSQKSDNFIPVTHKKKVRPVKNRKGKNVIRVQRTLQERLTASRVTMNTTGYLEACSSKLNLFSFFKVDLFYFYFSCRGFAKVV